jgi:hypothetical protein
VTNPTLWIIKDCIPEGYAWNDPSKIQIDEVFCLLDHWRTQEDASLDPLIWASTCPLLKDSENTTKTVQAGRQAQVLQPADSDEEVFVLPDSEELDFDSNGSDNDHLDDTAQSQDAPTNEHVISVDTPDNDDEMHHPDHSSSCEPYYLLLCLHIVSTVPP